MTTYMIVRYYLDGPAPEDVPGLSNLTSRQANLYCQDPENKSLTCTSPEGLARTAEKGGWYHDYVETTTYRIVRHYHLDHPSERIGLSGLSRIKAQAHCMDPETSSRTCTSPEGLARTEEMGGWYHDYEEDE